MERHFQSLLHKQIQRLKKISFWFRNLLIQWQTTYALKAEMKALFFQDAEFLKSILENTIQDILSAEMDIFLGATIETLIPSL